eukprot:scaffold285449_cov15-Tisochrysis_lutea.AAC.1
MSGLLAFDAALLDATQGGYNEDALDYNHLVQRYPSRFAVRSSMDASRRLPKLSPISEPYGWVTKKKRNHCASQKRP